METRIKKISAYQNYDSKGYPALYGELLLSDGRLVTTAIPNNQENAKYAANYLYDEEKFFNGRGLNLSLKYINELLAPKIVGIDPLRAKDIDAWLLKADVTENKEVLGVNSLLLISQLIYKAGALVSGMPLFKYLNKVYSANFGPLFMQKMPSPEFTLISGGKHGADTLDFQEYGILSSTSLAFSQALERAIELYHQVEGIFSYRNIFSGVGDEGAYVPRLSSNVDALEIVKESIQKQGLKIGVDVFFVIDAAASFFFRNGKYYLTDSPNPLTSEQFLEYWQKIFKEYRYLILEDPFAEDDFKAWATLTKELGERVYVIGDDLLAMNKRRLELTIAQNLCNVVNVKLTQRGTIWEVFEFVAGARSAKLPIMISQSAWETNDTFLADLAVALQADFIKFGAPVRGERIAKYNRLLALEKEIQSANFKIQSDGDKSKNYKS